MKPSLATLARDLGISRNAVHLALSGKDGLGDSLRKKIIAAALKQGYPVAGEGETPVRVSPFPAPVPIEQALSMEGIRALDPGQHPSHPPRLAWERCEGPVPFLELTENTDSKGPALKLRVAGTTPQAEHPVWGEVASVIKGGMTRGLSRLTWLGDGGWAAHFPRVSGAALARELGISPMTVSLALRGMPGVSEEARDAVARGARRMGLPGTVPARPVVLLLHQIPEARLGNWFPMAKHLERGADALGFPMTLVEHVAPKSALQGLAKNPRVRPDVVVTAAHTRAWFETVRSAFRQVPVVSVNGIGTGGDLVGEDVPRAVSDLMDRVLEGKEHPRLGYVTMWREGHYMERAREEAFRTEVESRGLRWDEDWRLPIPVEWDPAVSYEESDHGIFYDHRAFRRSLSERIGKIPGPVPDLIFCYNDRCARAVAETLEQCGKSVPPLTGWDGSPDIWGRTGPSPAGTLPSLIPPVGACAREAIRLVDRRLRNPSAPVLQVGCGPMDFVTLGT